MFNIIDSKRKKEKKLKRFYKNISVKIDHEFEKHKRKIKIQNRKFNLLIMKFNTIVRIREKMIFSIISLIFTILNLTFLYFGKDSIYFTITIICIPIELLMICFLCMNLRVLNALWYITCLIDSGIKIYIQVFFCLRVLQSKNNLIIFFDYDNYFNTLKDEDNIFEKYFRIHLFIFYYQAIAVTLYSFFHILKQIKTNFFISFLVFLSYCSIFLVVIFSFNL
ncbi:hypothetical protein H312_01942 [Anncaliia algerae PRA339]|uniref:Uncharacterized protein n=1 Tax=Anncaliia algerae PRA339 TaxID=1288291 RepID=A0A059F0H0_9MICR|nr:hypothetical protein H312_01942 [Anncaliia algerae PRA339]